MWDFSVIKDLLMNPVYTGAIASQKKDYRFSVHQGSSGTFPDFPQHMTVKGVIINPVLGAVVLSKGVVGLAGINPLGMFCVCVAYRQRLPTLAAF